MPIIKIDNIDYDTEKLSPEAKAQLEMLVVTENKIRQLQQDVLIAQTAYNAYAAALKAALPSPLEQLQGNGDTIKF